MKILFLILLIAYANLVNAQSNSFQQIISGKVVTEKNRPIDFATVSLLYASDSSLLKTTFSDEKGNYQFENIKDSTYIIAASLVGYRNTYSQKFKLNNQQNYKVSALTLPQESKNLKEVSITAQKPLIERRADKLILNVEASSTSVG